MSVTVPRPRKYTPELEEQICDAYVNSGKRVSEIASEFNIPEGSVYAILDRNRIRFRGKAKAVSAKETTELMETILQQAQVIEDQEITMSGLYLQLREYQRRYGTLNPDVVTDDTSA